MTARNIIRPATESANGKASKSPFASPAQNVNDMSRLQDSLNITRTNSLPKSNSKTKLLTSTSS